MRTKAKSISLRLIKTISCLIDFALLVFIVLMVLVAFYAMWDAQQIYSLADAKQYEIYKPAVVDEGQSFAELQAINPDVFSWLTVYGTNIDYPVTQAEDNWKYVNTNAQGEYAITGSIFLDAKNSPDFTDFNSILYGHHMEKQTMFGEIGLFANEEYFNARQYGNLYYNGANHGLEFFAFLHVDAYDTTVFSPGVQGEVLQQQYLVNLLEKAIYTRNVDITVGDHIVLLSTCSTQTTNGRDILVAKITDTVYENTLLTTDTGNGGISTILAQQLGSKWGGMLAWVWLLLIIVVILLVILLLVVRRKRRQKQQNANHVKHKHTMQQKDRGKHEHTTSNKKTK